MVTNSSGSGEITFKCDQKAAARKEPIKDNPILKAPIRGSHLGKRLCQSESGPTDMNPVVTKIDFIGQGGPQAISEGTHIQRIIQGRENLVHGDVITHMLTNPTQVSLGSDYFPFEPEQAKTLMVTSLVESLLASNGNVHSASIIGAIRPDQSRIFTPGMNKEISSRDDVGSTVRNDIGKADKLDATIEGYSDDEWNTASSRIEESTPKTIFRKVIKQL